MTECFPRCNMELCKVKDTLSLAMERGKVTAGRLITLHLSPGYLPLPQRVRKGARGSHWTLHSCGGSEPALFTFTISPHSTQAPTRGRGEHHTDRPHFHSCPLRYRSRYRLSSYCGEKHFFLSYEVVSTFSCH